MCVDLLEPLTRAAAETDLYFVDDGHWNESGNDLAAGTVAEAIRPLFEHSEQGTSN